MPARDPASTQWVGTVPIEVTDLSSAAQRVIDAARAPAAAGTSFRLTSAKDVAFASQDVAYRELLAGAGHNLPDGAPLVWAMRARMARFGKDRKKPARVRGTSLFRETLDRGRPFGLRHFFLGTTEETLGKLGGAAASYFPGVVICGSYAPPFGPLDEDFYQRSIKAIAEAEPDVVWVALGAPKQDFAAAQLAARTGRTCVAVGAAFDFLSGVTKEAPQWVQNSGFEWLYRLCAEPRRLWRRYLFGNAVFIYTVVVHSRRADSRRAPSHPSQPSCF